MGDAPHKHRNRWIRDKPSNSLNVVSEEARLFNEIKDIRDELNMLRGLAESQQHVWEQLFQTRELDSFQVLAV